MPETLTISCSKDRPGPAWHAHGTTAKWIWLIDADRLRRCRLLKQRRKHVETGETRHDRPTWDVPNSPYGLDVAFVLFGLWLLATVGLHRLKWPWANNERPNRRTVQRWLARLAPDGELWLQAIGTAVIEHVAPRHLEEILPAGESPRRKGARVATKSSPMPASYGAVPGFSKKRRASFLSRSAPFWSWREGGGRFTAQHRPDPAHRTGGAAEVRAAIGAGRNMPAPHSACRRAVAQTIGPSAGTPKEVPVPMKKPPSDLALLRYQAISAYLSLAPPRGQRAAILQQLAAKTWTLPDGRQVQFAAEDRGVQPTVPRRVRR